MYGAIVSGGWRGRKVVLFLKEDLVNGFDWQSRPLLAGSEQYISSRDHVCRALAQLRAGKHGIARKGWSFQSIDFTAVALRALLFGDGQQCK